MIAIKYKWLIHMKNQEIDITNPRSQNDMGFLKILLCILVILILFNTFNLRGNGVIKSHSSVLFRNPNFNIETFTGEHSGNCRNITSNDTIAPIADAGSYPPLYQGRTMELDAGGSSDNIPDLFINGTFNWTIESLNGTTLEGISVEISFPNPGRFEVVLEVTDASGNSGTDSVNITVLEDTIPPKIIYSTPSTKENIAENSTFRFIFSETIDKVSVPGEISFFKTMDETPIPCNWSLEDNDTVIALKPPGSLKENTMYTILIGSDITDLGGNGLDYSQAYEYIFTTTGYSPEIKEPEGNFRLLETTFIPHNPYIGDLVVIELQFNRNVNDSSIHPGSIYLQGNNGENVPIFAEKGTDESIIRIDILIPVEKDVNYKLNISKYLADEEGRSLNMTSPNIRSFVPRKTVEEKKDEGAPVFFIVILVIGLILILVLVLVIVDRVNMAKDPGYEEARERWSLNNKRAKKMASTRSNSPFSKDNKKRSKMSRKDERSEDRFSFDDREHSRTPIRRDSKRDGSRKPKPISYYNPDEDHEREGRTYEMKDNHNVRRRRASFDDDDSYGGRKKRRGRRYRGNTREFDEEYRDDHYKKSTRRGAPERQPRHEREFDEYERGRHRKKPQRRSGQHDRRRREDDW